MRTIVEHLLMDGYMVLTELFVYLSLLCGCVAGL